MLEFSCLFICNVSTFIREASRGIQADTLNDLSRDPLLSTKSIQLDMRFNLGENIFHSSGDLYHLIGYNHEIR